jgi:iron complex transport system permease protein
MSTIAATRGVQAESPPIQRWRTRAIAGIGLCVVLLAVIIAAASVGSADIPLVTTWRIVVSKLPFVDLASGASASAETIVIDIRLPRVLLAGLVGAALAIAGASYQGLLRNPLADPYLIGVSQGAMFGAVVGFLLPFQGELLGIGVVPVLAFGGALFAVAIVYYLARVGKTVPVATLILAGVAVGSMFSGVSSYLILKSGEHMPGVMSWVMGQFSLTSWDEVVIVLPYVLIGALVIWLHARALNVLQLDEEQAEQLGVNVERVKLALLIVATLMVAAAVSFCGIIGFVGIVVPHAARLLWGPDHRSLLPLSMLLGAIFLIVSDTLARTLLAPTEIPVSAVTAFFGAPFFLYLLKRRTVLLW